MAVPTDVERLAAYRLANDMTFQALADEMTAAGFPVKMRALALVLTGKTREPHERMRYKIHGFVEKKVPRRPRARRVAA